MVAADDQHKNVLNMKKPFIKLLGITIVVLAVFLGLSSLKISQKFRVSKSAEEVHQELINHNHLISPEKASEILDSQDQEYVFVDLRNPQDYDNFHIQDAVNVPYQRVLDKDYETYLRNSQIKILYSERSVKADQIRLLLTQYGYENLFVLQGGISHWKENMVSKNLFKMRGEYDDEKLIFDPSDLKKGS